MHYLKAPYELDNLDRWIKDFLNQDGWMLIFKPEQLEDPWITIDTIDSIYKRLKQWIDEKPNYYSAIIYRPNGMLHRTFRNGFKAFRR